MKSLLFSFQGRVNRAPYWYVHLVLGVIHFAVFGVVFATLIYPAIQTRDPLAMESVFTTMNIVFLVFIPFYWISLAVTVKRCHDRDRSGWWILIGLVPVIGAIWFIIDIGFLPGTPGPNRYGPDPLGY